MLEPIVVFCKDRSAAWLITRLLRWRQVYALSLPFDTPLESLMANAPKGVIISAPLAAPGALDELDTRIFDAGVPVLALDGIAAALCTRLGGQVSPVLRSPAPVALTLSDHALFQEMDHTGSALRALAPLTPTEGMAAIAAAGEDVIGYACTDKPIYALEYPIERNDPDATQILTNFAYSICKCRAEWNEDTMIGQAIDAIREAVPENGQVLCAISGGVDSAVCAKLAGMALGDRLRCLFVDTGLFRQGEVQHVISAFEESMGIPVEQIDAREQFLNALGSLTAADHKERTASLLMRQILTRHFAEHPELCGLVMGTNYSDILENDSPGEEPAVSVTILEPIRTMFKDEVRQLAGALGLPASIVNRQSFPSSGLALRIYGTVTEERLNLLRAADACWLDEIQQAGLDKRLWQYFATLVESPDQPGQYTICLRAIQPSQNRGLAARLPHDLMERATARILEEVPSVSRVVYDLTPSKRYGTIE